MLKAIETAYKGYRFRSRLEARWAVFFDAVGIKWEYEAEGYDLEDAGWYLPDFWLPDGKLWAEIKPVGEIPLYEQNKINALDDNPPGDGLGVIVLQGPPDDPYLPPTVNLLMLCGIHDIDFEGAVRAARSARFEHGETP